MLECLNEPSSKVQLHFRSHKDWRYKHHPSLYLLCLLISVQVLSNSPPWFGLLLSSVLKTKQSKAKQNKYPAPLKFQNLQPYNLKREILTSNLKREILTSFSQYWPLKILKEEQEKRKVRVADLQTKERKKRFSRKHMIGPPWSHFPCWTNKLWTGCMSGGWTWPPPWKAYGWEDGSNVSRRKY
jgi:hypothetical protein